jgi:hypothetical protein
LISWLSILLVLVFELECVMPNTDANHPNPSTNQRAKFRGTIEHEDEFEDEDDSLASAPNQRSNENEIPLELA